uniref:Carbohydrate kinase FGGY N-terminal domain-containing protein n=1 Tax=Ditylenchus dipsaci TaxID=166011 RepID=A0A915E068_9BILA
MSCCYLGIDLGTTNVKVCLINEQKEIIRQLERASNSNIINPQQPKWHEQDVKKVLNIAIELLNEFVDLFDIHKLECIGVSGQMHGVVLWQKSSLSNSVENMVCSNLITWMDQRCDSKFLEVYQNG